MGEVIFAHTYLKKRIIILDKDGLFVYNKLR